MMKVQALSRFNLFANILWIFSVSAAAANMGIATNISHDPKTNTFTSKCLYASQEKRGVSSNLGVH